MTSGGSQDFQNKSIQCDEEGGGREAAGLMFADDDVWNPIRLLQRSNLKHQQC